MDLCEFEASLGLNSETPVCAQKDCKIWASLGSLAYVKQTVLDSSAGLEESKGRSCQPGAFSFRDSACAAAQWRGASSLCSQGGRLPPLAVA